MLTAPRRYGVFMLCGVIIAGVILAGCSRPTSTGPTPGMPMGGPQAAGGQIRQVGSTTLLPLAERWRSEFNIAHPDINIAVSGGGSGTGIKALINKSAEIANSSREIKSKEDADAKANGVTPIEHLVAHDGIAVIVNPANPLKELSLRTLSDIYTGKTSTWDEIGGKGLGKIQIVNRDSSSGTYEAFKDMVVTLGGKDKTRDFAPGTMNQTSNEAVLNMVAQTKGAIGYIGLGYLNDTVKDLPIIPLAGGKAVAPTEATILNKTYPISRALYCYTNGEPVGNLKIYLDWIKGPEGQRLVTELGFVPVAATSAQPVPKEAKPTGS